MEVSGVGEVQRREQDTRDRVSKVKQTLAEYYRHLLTRTEPHTRESEEFGKVH